MANVKRALTQETMIAICEAYKDRDNKTADIAKKYGISRGGVARIAVELGALPRSKRYRQTLRKESSGRICPKCKKHIDTKGARFCCFCGADIRTGKEIAAARLEKVLECVGYLPQGFRDEARDAILNAIKELDG